MTRLILILVFSLTFFSCKTETQNNEREINVTQTNLIPDNKPTDYKISGIMG